jgi:hypothetical protein
MSEARTVVYALMVRVIEDTLLCGVFSTREEAESKMAQVAGDGTPVIHGLTVGELYDGLN